MNIKKSAWHYRLIKRFSDWAPPSNFCPYMRKLTGIMLLLFFVAPSVVYGMGEAVMLVWWGKDMFNEIWMATLESYSMWLAVHGAISALAGMLAWVVLGVCLIGVTIDLIKKMKDKYDIAKMLKQKEAGTWIEPTSEGYVRSEPTIVTRWLEAIHDKTCPIIEFTEK